MMCSRLCSTPALGWYAQIHAHLDFKTLIPDFQYPPLKSAPGEIMFDELPQEPMKTAQQLEIEAMRRGAVALVQQVGKMMAEHEAKKKGA
jgi:hypothetical protein